MKIGLAVVSYHRPDYLRQCLERLEGHNWSRAEERFVVVDHPPDDKYRELAEQFPHIKFIFHGNNYGVAVAKNTALKEMLRLECTELFLMEDDILMKTEDVCSSYIAYAAEIGVQHTNFALHGRMNTGHKVMIGPLCVYPNCVGAFSYYTKEALDRCGLFDEGFFNAYEHVEHTYRMAEAELTTPFWFFIDHPNSDQLLEEIPESIDNSSIRPRSDWQENIDNAYRHFVEVHGHWLPEPPDWEKVKTVAPKQNETS